MTAVRLRVAIVGSGIAGLTCAHRLGPSHDVVLFEAGDRLGGHANTVDVVDSAVGPLSIDTGFIVHNDRNYPNLVRLFDELDVPTIDTEMSFGVTDRDPSSPTYGFTYRATNVNTVFADRANLVRPTMWRMLRDIVRFYRAANQFMIEGDDTTTLDEFLDGRRFGRELVDLHLIPMGASVWSVAPESFRAFPAMTLFRFLDNHGLLGIGDRPQWRTIVGGSRVYVDEIERRFDGDVRRSTPVRRIEQGHDAVAPVVITDFGREEFDRVVLACHSDQALRLIDQPTASHREILGAIGYQSNRATLHTDTSLLSPAPRAWSAWNYDRRSPGQHGATLTYDLTALQHLPGDQRYLVSLNSDDHIDPDRVLHTFEYAHPIFDDAAIGAQSRFNDIDGVGGLHFCGAWWGHGFHEDGAVSGLRVCDRIDAGVLEEAV